MIPIRKARFYHHSPFIIQQKTLDVLRLANYLGPSSPPIHQHLPQNRNQNQKNSGRLVSKLLPRLPFRLSHNQYLSPSLNYHNNCISIIRVLDTLLILPAHLTGLIHPYPSTNSEVYSSNSRRSVRSSCKGWFLMEKNLRELTRSALREEEGEEVWEVRRLGWRGDEFYEHCLSIDPPMK